MANGAPSPNSTFDLEKRLKDFRSRTIKIAGREFHPAKETTETRSKERQLGRQRAKIARDLTEAAEAADESGDFESLAELEQKQEDVLYELAALQLVDEHDVAPDSAWLAQNFPIGQLADLYEFLSPEGTRSDSEDPS